MGTLKNALTSAGVALAAAAGWAVFAVLSILVVGWAVLFAAAFGIVALAALPVFAIAARLRRERRI
ncbi:hypothetical protein ACFVAJ_18045 [Agromyces sp. NPDC057679]|uniref:hypothetical protein n=1 Tax=Agromyces sp. NPDC057679 TaxID=3346207 RepID=UPI003671764C